MLHGSLSLGPPFHCGLPPDGRHHFAALMQRIRPKYDKMKYTLLGNTIFDQISKFHRQK